MRFEERTNADHDWVPLFHNQVSQIPHPFNHNRRSTPNPLLQGLVLSICFRNFAWRSNFAENMIGMDSI
jgi:hypothetical protein